MSRMNSKKLLKYILFKVGSCVIEADVELRRSKQATVEES